METVVKNIYVMDGGKLTVEGSTLVPGTNYGVPQTIPVQFFLLETTKGFILVDAGNDPDVITDPIGAWGFDLASASNPDMQPINHPYEQLKLLGLGADDIKMVIYTHLHHDHCGGGRYFPDALHVVQKAEHRWAFQPDSFARKPYSQKDFRQPTLRWQLAEGDWCILPGIHLLTTPGHTPRPSRIRSCASAPPGGATRYAPARSGLESQAAPDGTSTTRVPVSSVRPTSSS